MAPFSSTGRALLLVIIAGGSLVATSLAGPLLPDGDPVAGYVSAGGYRPDRQECKFLRTINNYRRQLGKQELALSPTLGAAADHHSEDMARHDYFSHMLKGEGISWSKNIRKHGYRENPIAENIAAGNAGAAQTFEQWKKSPGHRKNMLSASFEAIGIGRADDRRSEFTWYWTTTFGGEVDDEVRC